MSSPSFVLIKTSLLHRRAQVALTCFAFFWWFWGEVMTQHKTLTFSANLSASVLSPKIKKKNYPDDSSILLFVCCYFGFLIKLISNVKKPAASLPSPHSTTRLSYISMLLIIFPFYTYNAEYLIVLTHFFPNKVIPIHLK